MIELLGVIIYFALVTAAVYSRLPTIFTVLIIHMVQIFFLLFAGLLETISFKLYTNVIILHIINPMLKYFRTLVRSIYILDYDTRIISFDNP